MAEEKVEHTHGLMGTSSMARSPLDDRSPRWRSSSFEPRHEGVLEEWYETGVSPYRLPVCETAVRESRVKQSAREAIWRIRSAWLVLRHGFDPYEW